MKVLFFNSVAGHPKVAPALMGQAWNTLRPFNQFLGQAIHTAKQRQFRYQLPWERVRNLSTVRVEAVDTLLRVPRRSPGVVLGGWPADKAVDLSQQGFVVNRGVPFYVEEATSTRAGLRLRANIPLLPRDQVVWCGVQSPVEQEGTPPPPAQVTDVQGVAFNLLAQPRESDDHRHWLLLVEGVHADCDLVVDGSEVEALALPPMDRLRHLTDTAGRCFELCAVFVAMRDDALQRVTCLQAAEGECAAIFECLEGM